MTMTAEQTQEAPPKRTRRKRKATALDGVDRELLALLQKEGRMSNIALANRLQVSEGTVRRRLKLLAQSQAMSVVAVPNWQVLGYATEALIGLRVDLNRLDQAAAELAKLEPVQSVMIVTGPFDIFCWVVARSTQDLTQFLEKQVAGIDGVRGAQTFLALSVNKRAPLVRAA